MAIVRGVNAGLSFLLELALVAAVIYWGWTAHRGLPLELLTGVGLPAVLVVFWGFLMAPRAAHRLPWPWVPVVALVLFLLASLTLWLAGQPVLAIVFAGLALVNAVATVGLQQRSIRAD